MANARQWEYSSLAAAERHQAALDAAEGLPVRSVPVTPGKRTAIPGTYSAGAFGWSAHVVDIDELVGPPAEYAVQRAASVQKHEGKNVKDGQGDFAIPTNATAVNRTPKWDAARPRGVSGSTPA